MYCINLFLFLKDRPQIVYLTFDDAMTREFDTNFYTELFLPDQAGEYKFKNPNGCPIRTTFFVAGKSNEYDVVSKNFLNLFTKGQLNSKLWDHFLRVMYS